MVVALVKLPLLKSPAITQPREPVQAALVFLFWDAGLCPSPLGAATLVNSLPLACFRCGCLTNPVSWSLGLCILPRSVVISLLVSCPTSFPGSHSHSFSESGAFPLDALDGVYQEPDSRSSPGSSHCQPQTCSSICIFTPPRHRGQKPWHIPPLAWCPPSSSPPSRLPPSFLAWVALRWLTARPPVWTSSRAFAHCC